MANKAINASDAKRSSAVEINEKTKLPLPWIVYIIGGTFGVGAWMTNVSMNLASMSHSFDKMATQQERSVERAEDQERKLLTIHHDVSSLKSPVEQCVKSISDLKERVKAIEVEMKGQRK